MSAIKSNRWKSLFRLLRQLIGTAYLVVRQQLIPLLPGSQLKTKRVLTWDRFQEHQIKSRLVKQLEDRKLQRMRHLIAAPNRLSRQEARLVKQIKRAVHQYNRNNITRTAAYGRIYHSYPELHWALLAHMVSRNGGWSMTDLKGDLLSAIMEPSYQQWMYRTLERCNALIFRDAYPQLLLYDASKKQGRSMFHLLPEFGVSSFMAPIWELFWIQPQPAILTVALIINEQHVIEGRVVQRDDYTANVIGRLDFTLHGWLQMNQVVLPVGAPGSMSAVPLHLYGLTLERFDCMKERIAFGKQLYSLLFDHPHIHEGVLRYIQAVPHTGSRMDYWPHRFVKDAGAALSSGSLKRYYSPELLEVWFDLPHYPVEPGDWFRSRQMLDDLQLPSRPEPLDFTYLHEQMWLELDSIAQLRLNTGT